MDRTSEYDGILLRNKKEQTAKCNGVDESQNHCAKWKKPAAKEYVVYDSICFEILEKAKLT